MFIFMFMGSNRGLVGNRIGSYIVSLVHVVSIGVWFRWTSLYLLGMVNGIEVFIKDNTSAEIE